MNSYESLRANADNAMAEKQSSDLSTLLHPLYRACILALAPGLIVAAGLLGILPDPPLKGALATVGSAVFLLVSTLAILGMVSARPLILRAIAHRR